MGAYTATYWRAFKTAVVELRSFGISFAQLFKYAIKAANLAICFLGFSVFGGREDYRRSAELGVLASVFDLVSDGAKFESGKMDQFKLLAKATFAPEVSGLLFRLMDEKKLGTLRRDGLDRGVAALRVIIGHLKAEHAWPNDSDIVNVGILLQIVDDILDHEEDLKTDHLNFLRHSDAAEHIQHLLNWDYERQFKQSRYPLVLFFAIGRSKKIAFKIASLTGDPTQTTPGVKQSILSKLCSWRY